MRKEVKTITVYKYDELSDHAKQNALYHWQETGNHDGSEIKEALKAFERIFPVKVRDWSYGECGRDYIKWEFTGNDTLEEMSGIRLMTYIANNYFHDLWKGKYYSTRGYYDENRKYRNKKRSSKVIYDNSCVLTGVWIDHEILQPIYDFMKKPSKHTTFRDLMEECLESWVSACTKDYEHYYSEESFKDMCEANEWEFTENGGFYR